MGLFSHKYKYYYDATSQLLTDEDAQDDSGQALLTSIRNQTDLVADQLSSYIGGLSTNLLSYYAYGRDYYYYRQPTGSVNFTAGVDTELLAKTIATAEGYDAVNIIKANLTAPDARFLMTHAIYNGLVPYSIDSRDNPYTAADWDATTETGSFETTTNEDHSKNPWVSAVTNYDYDLWVYNVTVTQNTHTWFQQGGDASNGYWVDTSNGLGINIATTPSGSDQHTNSLLPHASLQLAHQYYQVSYQAVDMTDPTNPVVDPLVRTWLYDPDDGTYPDLDTAAKTPAGTYLPVVALRKDFEDLTRDDGSERYNTSRQLLKLISLDYMELGDTLNDATDDDGNDASQYIRSSYVICGVSTQGDSQAEKAYLFHFFNNIPFQPDAPTKESYLNGDIRGCILDIQEEAVNYHARLEWYYLDVANHAGTFTDEDGNKLKKGEYSTYTQGEPAYDSDYFYNSAMSLFIRKQRSGFYTEIEVRGLYHTCWVGGHEIETNLTDAKNSWVLNHDGDEDNDDYHDNMLIPLEYLSLLDVNPKLRAELGYHSIYLTINTEQKVKVKWYQRAFFKFVAKVVVVVIDVITMSNMASMIEKAIAKGTALAASAYLATAYTAVRLSSKFLVNHLGTWGAAIGAILGETYAYVNPYKGMDLATSGALMLSGSSKGAQAAIAQQRKELMDEINQSIDEAQKQQDQMNEYLDQQEDNLESAQSLLPSTMNDISETTVYPGRDIQNVLGAPSSLTDDIHGIDNTLNLPGVFMHYGIKQRI